MRIHKLAVGNAYEYLTRTVAQADARPDVDPGFDPDYYTARGTPRGIWLGQGLADLGLIEGGFVTEEQMKLLFAEGRHPDAAAIVEAFLAAHVRPDMSPAELRRVQAAAEKETRLGRRYPNFKTTGKSFTELLDERLAELRAQTGRAPSCEEESEARAWVVKQQKIAVAGFDTVFSPPKSVSVLWALHPDPTVREQVAAAHRAAIAATVAFLEEHAARTRVGAGGKAQIDARGLIIAAFDHFDNREGEPNLHTHAVIANKVQAADGRWLALDARVLHDLAVTASTRYDAAMRTEITERLGLTWTMCPDTLNRREILWELEAIRPEWSAAFSTRRHAITARLDKLVANYTETHGRRPDTRAYNKLSRQATLETRRPKGEARPLADKLEDWQREFTAAFGDGALAELQTRTAPTRTPRLDPARIDPGLIARGALNVVEEHRATWSRWNLTTEIERALAVHQGLTHADRELLTAAALEIALDASVLLNGYRPVSEPKALRRADGVSVFVPHGSQRYTSQAILDAETRLLAAASTPGKVRTGQAVLAPMALAAFEAEHGRRLDAGQRALATEFAYDTRALSVGVGPAGAGKTTAMRALAAVVEADGRRLVPLATTGAAAKRLAAELDRPVETVHKFLAEHSGFITRTGRGDFDFTLGPGDTVLVDEASMAGTKRLAWLLDVCEANGATLRLLGDPEQLAAVETGGMLRLLVAETDHVELTGIYRFADPAYAQTTLALRKGDAQAIDYFADRGLLHAGDRETMLDQTYTKWQADEALGRTSLMITATNRNVDELNARARTDRIAAGHVEVDGHRLADDNTGGVGDRIVTRETDRTLRSTTGDYVRNGELWTITGTGDDGTLTAKRHTSGDTVTLPAAYVRNSTQLAYAATSHRVQGDQADTTHDLIDGKLDRQQLYVMATRGIETTNLYVVTDDHCPGPETEPLDTQTQTEIARTTLTEALARDGVEPTATQTLRDALEQASSLGELVPRAEYLAARFPAEQDAEPVQLHPALPWLKLPPADLGGDPELGDYLDQVMAAVDVRIDTLVDRIVAERPDWATPLLPAEDAPAGQIHWRSDLAVVAAWREMQDIDSDKPWGPWVYENDRARPGFEAAVESAEAARFFAGIARGENPPQHQTDRILGRDKPATALHPALVAYPAAPNPINYGVDPYLPLPGFDYGPTQPGPTITPR